MRMYAYAYVSVITHVHGFAYIKAFVPCLHCIYMSMHGLSFQIFVCFMLVFDPVLMFMWCSKVTVSVHGYE